MYNGKKIKTESSGGFKPNSSVGYLYFKVNGNLVDGYTRIVKDTLAMKKATNNKIDMFRSKYPAVHAQKLFMEMSRTFVKHEHIFATEASFYSTSGGLITAKPGTYYNMVYLDLNSMYPSILTTCSFPFKEGRYETLTELPDHVLYGIYKVSITEKHALFRNNKDNLYTHYDRHITLAKSGGDYTTLTSALSAAAALLPTATNPVQILVYPGEYSFVNPQTVPSYVLLTSLADSANSIVKFKGTLPGLHGLVLSNESAVDGITIANVNYPMTSSSGISRVSNCVYVDCIGSLVADNGAICVAKSCTVSNVSAFTVTGFQCETVPPPCSRRDGVVSNRCGVNQYYFVDSTNKTTRISSN